MFTLLLAIFILIVIGFILIYNRLVRNKYLVQEGWSGIDVQLKRRADLIPNLVDAIKSYMAHEKELLSKLTELRVKSLAARDVEKKSKIEEGKKLQC